MRTLIGFVRRWRVVLAVLPLMVVACATVVPLKTTSPEPFLGNWIGSWRSQTNPARYGEVEVEITRDVENQPHGLRLTAKLTNVAASWFAATGVLTDGQLAFIGPGETTLQFVLYGEDRLEATYYYPKFSDSGTWSLKRPPR